MAIEFALFGLGSQKAESLLAKKSESGYVTLEFSVDGKKYEIRRTLSRKNSKTGQDPKNSWIKIEGEKEPLSPSELKQRILQILKFNEPDDPKAESRIFRYAVFTPQEAMKEVLADAKKRLETIRRAFGIEDYSIAASNAQEVSNEIKLKMAALQGRFGNIPELEEENVASQKIVTELKMSVLRILQEKEKHEAAETRISTELEGLLEKDRERVRAETQKESKKIRIDDAKREVEKIEKNSRFLESDLESNNSKFHELDRVRRPDTTKSSSELEADIAKFQHIIDELNRCSAEKEVIEGEISRLRKALGEKTSCSKMSLENNLTELQKTSDSQNKVLDELKEEQSLTKGKKIQKQTEASGLDEEINKFSQLGNVCPTCRQGISKKHHHELVGKKQEKVKILRQEINALSDSLAKTELRMGGIETEMISCNSKISKIEKDIPMVGELEARKSRLVEIVASISKLQRENFDKAYGENPIKILSDIRDQLIQYESVKSQKEDLAEAKTTIEGKIKENHKLKEERLEFISSEERELKKLQESKEFEGLDVQMHEKKSQLNMLKKDISEVTASLAQKNERKSNEESKILKNKEKIAESKKWQERFSRISEYSEWLDRFFIPTMSEIERQVLLSILQNFNETYRRWYSILVEDPTKESMIDEDFTPTISQDGYEQDVRYLSGGEKTSVALAYRLTLNSLIRKETESMKSNLLILDEPTDGFSKNQLGKIRELLDELKSEQVILVSHEKELETYVDNVFEISKHGGVSRISESAVSTA